MEGAQKLLKANLLLCGLPLLLRGGGGFSSDPTQDLDKYGIFMPFLYFNCSADYQRVAKAASKIPIWMSVCCDHTDPSSSGPAWPGSPWPVDGQPGSGLLNPNPCHLKNKMGQEINHALDQLRAAGVKITHYVHTRVTNYPNGSYAPCCQCCETLANITERIETEIAKYPMDGIFIDNLRAGHIPAPESWFQEVYDRTQAHGRRLVVSNPGGYLFPEPFMNISDIICAFESPGHVFNSSDGGCGHVRRPGRQYPDCDRDFDFTPWRNKLSMLAYPTPADQWRSLLELAAKRDYTKFWFNDHDTGDTIPPYFEEMVDAIAALTHYHPPPSPPPRPVPPPPPPPPPAGRPTRPFEPWTQTIPLDPANEGQKLSHCSTGSKHGTLLGGSAFVPVPESGHLYFLQFGSNSFAPDQWELQAQSNEHGVKEPKWLTVNNSLIAVRTIPLDTMFPLFAQEWNISAEDSDTSGWRPNLRLRASKCWDDPNKHWFFSKLILLNNTGVLSETTAALRPPVHVGVALSALPEAVRNASWTHDEIQSQYRSLTDPILDQFSAEGKGEPEVTSRDPRIESAAFPMDHMRIPLASRNDTESGPAVTFQNGQWVVTQTNDAWHQNTHGKPGTEKGKIELWVVPALESHAVTVMPTPLSAKTGWKRSPSGMALPIFTVEWAGDDDTQMSQRLSSFKLRPDDAPCSCGPGVACHGLCHSMVVAHFKTTSSTKSSKGSVLLGLGRQPGMEGCVQEAEHMVPDPEPSASATLYAFDCIWAAQHTWNNYRVVNPASGGGMIYAYDPDGSCSVVLISSAPLVLVGKGVTETHIRVGQGPTTTTEFFVATPQRSLACDAGISSNLPTFDEFVQREEQNEVNWLEWLNSGARMELPSEFWADRMAIWRTQVASLGILGDELSYGAWDVYGSDFEGVEEGWLVNGMMMHGFLLEAREGITTLLDPAENLARTRKGFQYRNGLAQYYAATHARLSGDLDWLKSVQSQLINNSMFTSELRKSGWRDAVTQGLLPQRYYDSSDIQIPATPLFSNVAAQRGALDTASLLKKLVEPALATSLQREADSFRAALVRSICLCVNTSVGIDPPYTPTSLEMGGRANLSEPRPADEQPYNFLASTTPIDLSTKLGNYWILWVNNMLHLGLWQWTGNSSPWEGGACRPDGTVDGGSSVLPAPLLTSWAEQHGGNWGGLPRFFYGLDAVYHGYVEHLIVRAQVNITARPQAIAAIESFMMHAASSNGFSFIEVSALFPRRMNRSLMVTDAVERPWIPYVTYDEYFVAEDGDSEPLGAGAGAGLVILRRALINEGVTPPSPLPDGRLFLLTATPADFLTIGGAGVTLERVPTSYGLVNFSASVSKGKAEVKFSCTMHEHSASMNLEPLSDVMVRLVVPNATVVAHLSNAVGAPWRWYDNHTVSFKPIVDAKLGIAKASLSIPMKSSSDTHATIKTDDLSQEIQQAGPGGIMWDDAMLLRRRNSQNASNSPAERQAVAALLQSAHRQLSTGPFSVM
eukprot:COSAG05_NODE_310_length_11636_cov_115.006934_2_plen_1499_part_00